MEDRCALKALAAHGSISHGTLAPERLRAILLGDAICSGTEFAQIEQALTETDISAFYTLAREIDLSFTALDKRIAELTGYRLEEIQEWLPGGSF